MKKRIDFFGVHYPFAMLLGIPTYVFSSFFIWHQLLDLGRHEWTIPDEKPWFIFDPLFMGWFCVTVFIVSYIWYRRISLDPENGTLRIWGRNIPMREIENLHLDNRLTPKDLSYRKATEADMPAEGWSCISFDHG